MRARSMILPEVMAAALLALVRALRAERQTENLIQRLSRSLERAPMSKAPQLIRKVNEAPPGWLVKCPGCGLEAIADEDQVNGRVSMDCPECPYHETHNILAVSTEP